MESELGFELPMRCRAAATSARSPDVRPGSIPRSTSSSHRQRYTVCSLMPGSTATSRTPLTAPINSRTRCRNSAPHCRSDRADAGESRLRLSAIQTVLIESVKVELAEPGNRGERQEGSDGHEHPDRGEAEPVGKLLVSD